MTEEQAYAVLAQLKSGQRAYSHSYSGSMHSGADTLENTLYYRPETDDYCHHCKYAAHFMPVEISETILSESQALSLLLTWQQQSLVFFNHKP